MNSDDADISCLDYNHSSYSHQQKTPWTETEDQKVRDAIDQGLTKWSEIARRFAGSRTGKQCRERWFNQLDPQLKRTPWTDREDSLLLKAHSDFGNCWKRISKELTGRSENEIKNRFYSAEIKRKVENSSSLLTDQFPMHKKCKPSRSSTNSNSHPHPSRGGDNVVDSQTNHIDSLLKGEGKYSLPQSPSLGIVAPEFSPQNRCSSSNNKRRYSRDSTTTTSSSFDYHPSASTELSPHLLHGIDEALFHSINAHRDLIPSEEDFLAYAVAEIYLSELRKFSPDSRKKTLEIESGKWTEVTAECFQSFSPDSKNLDGNADQTLYSNTLDTDDNFSEYSTSSSLIHLTISEDNQVTESVCEDILGDFK